MCLQKRYYKGLNRSMKPTFHKRMGIKREATTGVVLTREVLEPLINERLGEEMPYEEGVPVVLRSIAQHSQLAGIAACGYKKCELTCSGTSLVDHTTDYDCDLTVRCITPTCTDEGVTTANGVLYEDLGLEQPEAV